MQNVFQINSNVHLALVPPISSSVHLLSRVLLALSVVLMGLVVLTAVVLQNQVALHDHSSPVLQLVLVLHVLVPLLNVHKVLPVLLLLQLNVLTQPVQSLLMNVHLYHHLIHLQPKLHVQMGHGLKQGRVQLQSLVLGLLSSV